MVWQNRLLLRDNNDKQAAFVHYTNSLPSIGFITNVAGIVASLTDAAVSGYKSYLKVPISLGQSSGSFFEVIYIVRIRGNPDSFMAITLPISSYFYFGDYYFSRQNIPNYEQALELFAYLYGDVEVEIAATDSPIFSG